MRSRAVLCALLAVAAVLSAGCGTVSGDLQSAPGSLAATADLHGQTYVVGGKTSDDGRLFCEMTIAALESAGAGVTDRCDIGSTNAVRAALASGDINLYWEYTGTAWMSFLGGTGQPRPAPGDQLYERVKQDDLARNGVVWLDRTRFDSATAFAVSGPKAAQLRLNTISDMAGFIRSGQPGTVCVDHEYPTRENGLRGLQRAYDVTVGPDRTQVLDAGLVYQSTADGVCTFGEVSTTDGRITGLGLKVLDDDRNFHLVSNAAPTVRRDAFDRAPQIAAVLDPIAAALDQPTMQALNARVSVDGVPARDVARGWLVSRGFVGAP